MKIELTQTQDRDTFIGLHLIYCITMSTSGQQVVVIEWTKIYDATYSEVLLWPFKVQELLDKK